MNLMFLFNHLNNERKALEKCWSNHTAYPDLKVNKDLDQKSKGQCFVTSVYLYFLCYKIIRDKTDFTIKRGYVENSFGEILIKDHCWLEGELKFGKHLIIDLTADQSIVVNKSVIFGSMDFISSQFGIKYVTKKIYKKNDLRKLDKSTKTRCLQLINKRYNL